MNRSGTYFCNISAARVNGFTLIEVSIALAMVAVGLLTIFALFPIGLKESEFAVQDTQEAMFADTVLNTIVANAMAIKDWNMWLTLTNSTASASKLTEGIYPSLGTWKFMGGACTVEDTKIGGGVKFPLPYPNQEDSQTKPRKMRYKIKVSGEPNRNRLRKVELWALSNQYGDFKTKAKFYYTEIFYTGM